MRCKLPDSKKMLLQCVKRIVFCLPTDIVIDLYEARTVSITEWKASNLFVALSILQAAMQHLVQHFQVQTLKPFLLNNGCEVSNCNVLP